MTAIPNPADWQYQVTYTEFGDSGRIRILPCKGRSQAESMAIAMNGIPQRVMVEDLGLHWEETERWLHDDPSWITYALFDGANKVDYRIAPPVHEFTSHPRYGTGFMVGELDKRYDTLEEAQRFVVDRCKETWT